MEKFTITKRKRLDTASSIDEVLVDNDSQGIRVEDIGNKTRLATENLSSCSYSIVESEMTLQSKVSCACPSRES